MIGGAGSTGVVGAVAVLTDGAEVEGTGREGTDADVDDSSESARLISTGAVMEEVGGGVARRKSASVSSTAFSLPFKLDFSPAWGSGSVSSCLTWGALSPRI